QTHGQGRRGGAGRHRRAAWCAHACRGGAVRLRPQAPAPLSAGRLLMNALSQDVRAVRTTCPYCGVGCGLLAKAYGQGRAAVIGDPEHPANRGRLCSKGAALADTLGLSSRLLQPMRRTPDGSVTRVTWAQALDQVAEGFRSTIARHGTDAVAFYLSGQLLT